MRAMILAAGRGTRLGELTRHVPKPLVRLADGVRIIDVALARLTEAGIDEIAVNLHHHAEITMKAGRFSLRGRARSEDMYASIDAAAEKIERQLMKHKERVRDHKSTAIPKDWVPVDVRHDILDEPKDAPSARVTSTSTFQARPMSLDEAIVQMDLLNVRFYVFQDAKTRGINVVYRRDDGKLGVIEVRAA